MPVFGKILEVENRFIDLLTGFTWWTESRWGLTNVWWAARANLAAFVFGVFAASFLFMMETALLGKMFWAACFAHQSIAALFLFVIGTFCPAFPNEILSKAFLQGCPNPNRANGIAVPFRRLALLSPAVLAVFIVFCEDYGYWEQMALALLVFWGPSIFMDVFYYFFLACDTLPPRKKEEMRNAREKWKRSMSAGSVP